jgi:hypothetical protein
MSRTQAFDALVVGSGATGGWAPSSSLTIF